MPVALITGASRGIGRGLAEFFARRGYHVVGLSRSEPQAPIEGGSYEHLLADVTDETALRRVISEVERRHKRLDVLINSAGLGLSALAVMSPTQLTETVLRVNFLGTFLACREGARVMMKKKFGRIINFASVAVPLHMEGASVYSASKAAVIQFSKVLAKEVAPFQITCNVVAPSLVQTDMMRELKPEAVNKYLEGLTIHRSATLEEVCHSVWFFAQPESGYLTGQVLYMGLA